MSWLTDYVTDAVDEAMRPDPEDFGVPMALSGVTLLVIGAVCAIIGLGTFWPGLVVGGSSLVLLPLCAGIRWTWRRWKAGRERANTGCELRLVDGGRR